MTMFVLKVVFWYLVVAAVVAGLGRLYARSQGDNNSTWMDAAKVGLGWFWLLIQLVVAAVRRN